jgi:hypothetical protein
MISISSAEESSGVIKLMLSRILVLAVYKLILNASLHMMKHDIFTDENDSLGGGKSGQDGRPGAKPSLLGGCALIPIPPHFLSCPLASAIPVPLNPMQRPTNGRGTVYRAPDWGKVKHLGKRVILGSWHG